MEWLIAGLALLVIVAVIALMVQQRHNRDDLLQSAGSILQPVRETLDKIQAQLHAVDKERAQSFGAVAQQLTSVAHGQRDLQTATEGLSRSLRSPNVRGVWGETQLRRVIELAGMLHQCDFIEKESADTPSGARQTPDLVVKLPGGTNIVIDSKVPIDAYLKAAEATTDEARASHMAQHARQVRDHVRALGSKEYWKQFQPSPEFVVMFLPLEPLLGAAFEQDAALLEQAASLRVIPATPMTLLALLKAVAYGWQQQQLTRNTEEIQVLGRELYERLSTMASHLERLGGNIKAAGDAYDSLVGSLERNVLPGARKFKDLGVNSAKELEPVEQLKLSVRSLRNDELIDSDEPKH